MKIGVIGINHLVAGVALREKLACACLKELSFSSDRVILTTCNRTEVYFSAEDLPETQSYLLGLLSRSIGHQHKPNFYSYFATDCFCHLAKVTAGLDSAICGETEIQGQVKNAYEMAKSGQMLSPELHYLFQRSLAIGKEVRSKLAFQESEKLEQCVLRAGYALQGKEILFVGASKTNEKIWTLFDQEKVGSLSLCNRSPTEFFPGKILEWNTLDRWHQFDWVIFATGYPDILIHHLPKKAKTKLICDLSVPRNVNPHIGEKIQLLNIDEIQQSAKKSVHFDLAESLVVKKASLHTELFVGKLAKAAGL